MELIDRLTPQCRPQFRSEENKINFLRSAVVCIKWAMIPVGSITSAKYTFNQLVTALREHLQLDLEIRSNITRRDHRFNDALKSEIMY